MNSCGEVLANELNQEKVADENSPMEKGMFSHLFDGSFSINKSGFHGKSANFAAVLNTIRFFFMQIDYALIRFTRGKNAARGVAHSLLFSLFLFVSLQLSARDITPKAALSIARRYVEVGDRKSVV